MKINSKHMIIPALMTAVGIALVGSVSGTVAWYQYSTRVQTSIVGTSVKCTENLQMRIGASGNTTAWGSEFKTLDITGKARAGAKGTAFQPVTTNVVQETAIKSTADGQLGTFKGHPKYQSFEYAKWKNAPENSYLQYDIWFRVLDVDGAEAGHEKYLAKKIYFENFTLQALDKDSNELASLKSAMRFHFANVTDGETENYTLLSETASTTYLGSKLDLNKDNNFDKEAKYEFEEPPAAAEKVYGDLTMKQVSASYGSFVAPTGSGDFIVPTASTKDLGTTVGGTHLVGAEVADGKELHFVVTIWLEGWAGNETNTGFATAASSIWDAADYLGKINIGMRFGITEYGQE